MNMQISYDLHIHSALSPCAEKDMTPGNIIGMAYLNGLELIAVTDHMSCANVDSALAAAERLRMETGKAPVIIPGMEIECAEGFHLLAYFPDPGTAASFEKYLTAHRFRVPNRPDIFGEQYLYDRDDQICGTIPDLLLTACDLSSNQLAADVMAACGCLIPAHIDRHSYSMLESLGCIPEEFPGKILELSGFCDREVFAAGHPELLGFSYMQNSDAHRLGDISDPGCHIEFPSLDSDKFDMQHAVESLREKTYR